MNTSPLVTDIVGLFIFIAALIFSNEAAVVVGPYLVIAVAASVGASFGLARKDKMTRTTAVGFFLRQIGIAVILTGGTAAIVNAYRPDLSPRVTIAPISLLLGFLDWPWALGKAANIAVSALDLLRGKGGSQ